MSGPAESSDVTTTPKPTPIYDDVSAPKDSSNSASTPKVTSGYQDISELPETRQVLTNQDEHGVEENESSSSSHSSVSSVSANAPPPQPLPIDHEVHNLTQRETPPPLLTPEQSPGPDRCVSPELSHSPLLVQEVLSSPHNYHVSSRQAAFVSTFQTTNSPRPPNMLGYPQTHSFVPPSSVHVRMLPRYTNVAPRAPRTVVDEWEEYRIPPDGTLV